MKISLRPLLWPTVSDHATARHACRLGYWAATVLALMFCVSGMLATFVPANQPGHEHIWDWLDAGVFMFLGWNIRYHGRKSAFAAAALCIFEALARFSWLALPGWIVLVLWAINGARGAQALLKLPPEPEVIPAER